MKKLFFGILFFTCAGLAQTEFKKEIRPISGIPAGSTVTFETQIFIPKNFTTITLFKNEEGTRYCSLVLAPTNKDRLIAAGTKATVSSAHANGIYFGQNSRFYCDQVYSLDEFVQLTKGVVSFQLAPDENTDPVQF